MGERVHAHLKAWDEASGCPQRGFWSPAGHSSQAVPWDPPLPSFPADPQPGALAGTKGEGWIQLLPHSPPDDHHSTDSWLNDLLTVAH